MFINKAIIYGNITKNIELRSIPTTGKAVATFSVATNRVWKDAQGNKKQQADFHNIVAYGKTAEIVAKYMSKGSGIYIEGRIQTRSWQDKQGNKRYMTEIVAENVQFGPKPANKTAPAPAENGYLPTPPPEEPPLDEIKVEDIPM